MKKAVQRLLISTAFCTLVLLNIQCMDESTKEIWKDVVGYEGFYQVSSIGRIKSLGRILVNSRGYSVPIPVKILKPQKRGRYLKIDLTNINSETSQLAIHRLVAMAFCENTYNYPVVNHKDSDPSNSHFYNLEWCTYKHNTHQWMFVEKRGRSGANHPNTTLTIEQVNQIRDIGKNNGITTRDIAKKFGVSQYCIVSIINRKTWKNV